jgi:hypothetical protein
MKTTQLVWKPATGWTPALPAVPSPAGLLLVFGARAALATPGLVAQIRAAFPAACLLGCSTAGEIHGTHVVDDTVVLTAVTFAHTQVRGVSIDLGPNRDSWLAGEALIGLLPPELPGRPGAPADRLAHVLVLSDGLQVNGSELVAGMTARLPSGVAVTGGLAGDGAAFGATRTLMDDRLAAGAIVAVGLYGARLRVGIGSLGGWDPFGPERLVTRAEGNVLCELDGYSALGLYKKYLGEHAAGLPATGLHFPLSLRRAPGQQPVVRTILNVDENRQSIVFAGDIPEGSRVQLMKANFDRVVDGAIGAASSSREALGGSPVELALLISCVGRKLALKQRIEEEVEGVRDVLGPGATFCGFYSYGEIAPFRTGCSCELHNQSMTVTTMTET